MARLKRKPRHEAHENHERYLITYADLITLLLVFFIVMFSISNADKQKFLRVSTSLREAFHVDVLAKPDQSLGGPSSLENDPRFMTYLSIRGQVAALVSRMALSPDNVDVEMNSEGIVIHLNEAILFPPGEAQLRPDALAVLDSVAQILQEVPNQIRVEGHTDNVAPANTSIQDNWELSTMRAVTTVRYLTDVQQITPERLAAVGFGEFRPRAENDTLEGRRKNRRVDIVIVERSVVDNNVVSGS
jgi:chemotaxis protein MotB